MKQYLKPNNGAKQNLVPYENLSLQAINLDVVGAEDAGDDIVGDAAKYFVQCTLCIKL